MRRSTIILIVAGAMLLALPATAKKPSPKPPPPSAPVAATLNPDLHEVHEAGDVIWYDVTVQNKSSAPVDVEVLYDGDGEPGSLSIEVEANSAHVEERLFSQTVEQSHIKRCADYEICDLIGQVTVQYLDGDLIAVAQAETSTPINPVDECIFEKDSEPVVTKSGLCIWKPEPTDTGLWTLSAVPEPEPIRPTRVMMTMRDGVPGNWCTLEDGSGGVIQDRLKGSEPIVLNVYLPGDDGVCLLGGHGGCTGDDCYFAVGNPKSFYLYTTFDGFITVTETEVVPGD